MELINEFHQRKRRFGFSLEHDVALMKQVREMNPFASQNPKRVWEQIANNLQKSSLRMNVNSRTCKSRAELLLGQLGKERESDGLISKAARRANEVEQLLDLESIPNHSNVPPQKQYEVYVKTENNSEIDDSCILENDKIEQHTQQKIEINHQINHDDRLPHNSDPFSKIDQKLTQLCTRLGNLERTMSRLLCWTRKQDGICGQILEAVKRNEQKNVSASLSEAEQQGEMSNASDDIMPIAVMLEEYGEHLPKEEDEKAKPIDSTGDYKCEICLKTFPTKSEHEEHSLNVYCGIFFCEICGKSYKTRGSLSTHQKEKHSGSLKHVCSICGKGFSRSLRLKEHIRLHSDARDYKCQYCYATFRQKVGLQIHEKRHLGVNAQAKCMKCGQTFITNYNLRKHIESVHDKIRRYLCPICGKPFKTPSHLKYHVQTHSNPNSRQRGLNRDCSDIKIKRKGGFHLVNKVSISHTESLQTESAA